MEFSIVILFVSLLLFSSTCSGDSNNTYHVNSSSDLEQYLCNTTWSSQHLVFLLNSSVNFTISPGNFCQVSSQTIRVDIRSDSPTQSVVISCFHDNIPELPRRGLVFFNTSVTLERLIFKDCGTYLITIQDNIIIEYLNSSSLHYTSSHAAALVFVHCQVNITQVHMYNSYGFAMIGVNLYDSNINGGSMSSSSWSSYVYQQTNRSIGNGAMIHFLDHPSQDQLWRLVHKHVSINSVYFQYNDDGIISHNQCIIDLYHVKRSSYHIVNAAGLTVLYTQKKYSTNVLINGTSFISNIGGSVSPGGLLVLHFYTSMNSTTVVDNSHFSHNFNIGSPQSYCHGTTFVFFWLGEPLSSNLTFTYPLIVYRTIFFDNSNIYLPFSGAGPIFIGILNPTSIGVLFKNCSFLSTSAYQEGACMYAITFKSPVCSGSVNVVLEDVIAKDNYKFLQPLPVSTSGVFSFYDIHSINITGTSFFDNNYGSVIKAVDSDVYLSGNVTFNNNNGLKGAAIRLQGKCCLYFVNGVSAMFTNNHAQLEGGAIYVESTYFSTVLQRDCVFSFPKSLSSSVVFNRNTAITSGNSIYMEFISECYLNESSNHVSSVKEIMVYYEQHFNFVSSLSKNDLNEMSAQPSQLFVCDYSGNDCDCASKQYRAYPGQKIQLYLTAVDALNRSVYSIVGVDITNKGHRRHSQLWLSNEDKEQIINESPNCTSITLAIHSHVNSIIADEKIVFSLPMLPDACEVGLEVHPCPLGFTLSKTIGKCVCLPVFYNQALIEHAMDEYNASCDINTLTIRRSEVAYSWAGVVENDIARPFGTSFVCPVCYCNCVPSLYFCSDDSDISLVSPITGTCKNSVPLCLHQRVGPLCGSCGNLSVVFGTSECRQCSHWWLWTLILYAVAGPLLIYLLYTFRLTLTTGTLNGIIFFAQAANCGMFELLSLCNINYQTRFVWLTNVSYAFLSLLNLNLGFPLCFYNGMTELWKTGFSLLFPLYLLTIVVVLIILSHFSLRISNRMAHSSVQVLVTVVHLSFSKLFLATIDVFTPAQIYTANTTYKVWYFDGSVEYGVGSHLILMIVTLLVVIPLLLPYILLLIFARPIRRTRLNEYVRPLLEAIHAPYKERKEYWFVARLFLLVFLCAVYSYYRAQFYLKVYVVSTPVFVMFLVLQTYHKPFKSKLVNIMDCLLMYSLAFLYSTTWMFIVKDNMYTTTTIVIITVSLVFLILLIVLVYHILCVTGKISVIKRTLDTKYCQYKWKVLSLCFCSKSNGNCQLSNADDSFYGSCQYREPLLISRH